MRVDVLSPGCKRRAGSGHAKVVEVRRDRDSPAREAAYNLWYMYNPAGYRLRKMAKAHEAISTRMKESRLLLDIADLAKSAPHSWERKMAVWVLDDKPLMLEAIAIESTNYDSAAAAIRKLDNAAGLRRISMMAALEETRQTALCKLESMESRRRL